MKPQEGEKAEKGETESWRGGKSKREREGEGEGERERREHEGRRRAPARLELLDSEQPSLPVAEVKQKPETPDRARDAGATTQKRAYVLKSGPDAPFPCSSS
eukprot:4013364-Pleurochrysis_carterae.AAC.1